MAAAEPEAMDVGDGAAAGAAAANAAPDVPSEGLEGLDGYASEGHDNTDAAATGPAPFGPAPRGRNWDPFNLRPRAPEPQQTAPMAPEFLLLLNTLTRVVEAMGARQNPVERTAPDADARTANPHPLNMTAKITVPMPSFTGTETDLPKAVKRIMADMRRVKQFVTQSDEVFCASVFKDIAKDWYIGWAQNKSGAALNLEACLRALKDRFDPEVRSETERAMDKLMSTHIRMTDKMTIAAYRQELETLFDHVPDLADSLKMRFFRNGLTADMRPLCELTSDYKEFPSFAALCSHASGVERMLLAKKQVMAKPKVAALNSATPKSAPKRRAQNSGWVTQHKRSRTAGASPAGGSSASGPATPDWRQLLAALPVTSARPAKKPARTFEPMPNDGKPSTVRGPEGQILSQGMVRAMKNAGMCFGCGMVGHRSSECPTNKYNKPSAQPPASG